MATVANSIQNPTIADVQNSIDKNGDFAYVANLLQVQNDVFKYMTVIPANEGVQHRSFVNVSLPTVYRRQFNVGTPASMGKNQPIVNQPGMFTSTLQMDAKLLKRFPNGGAKYRFDQGNRHFEAMGQEVCTTLIYGNALTNPDDFPGLAYFYSSPTAANGEHVRDGGGRGSDNTSMYLVTWNEYTISAFYPDGSTGGFEHIDHGMQRAHNFNGVVGNTLTVWEDEFNWDLGLEITDYRGGARVANISTNALLAQSGEADLGMLMDQMIVLEKPVAAMGRQCFIMNITCFYALLEQRKAQVAAGGGVRWDTIDGQLIYSYMGIPIAITNAIGNNESPVTGF